jgi:dTDP-4-amino-4,6-dideoxygalactose transaminase
MIYNIKMIPYNKPYLTGKETEYIRQAVESGKISGNGMFTEKCQSFFGERYNYKKCLLTSSCTDALEMAAILSEIKPGDEIIVPSFTFVSSALAFVRQGAKIVFADSFKDHPNLDTDQVESLVTSRTRAIVPVHYAGMACDMDRIMDIAGRHNLLVVEDAAQAIDSFYLSANPPHSSQFTVHSLQLTESGPQLPNPEIRNHKSQITNHKSLKPLGSIGHFGCFSFHETKNIQCGEGGMIAINDEKFGKRAEIIWEKGTNRAEFFRGEVDKYGWVDIGSSFLPSEINAAFLYAQLENLQKIQQKRKLLWDAYCQLLKPLADQGLFAVPSIPSYATNNAHMFYLVCNSPEERTRLIVELKKKGIMAVFHYQSLHKSKYYHDKHDGRELPNSDRFTDCLVRLPLYYDLTIEQVKLICSEIHKVF